jgi:hypothetical protein
MRRNLFESFYLRRKNLLLWPSILHFDISTTFYLLTIINSIHMSIKYIQMNWKSKTPQGVLHLLRIEIGHYNSKITTQLYDKRDDFNFSIVNFPYLCSNIIRGSLLTKTFMSQGFQLSRLQAAFRKFYGRYNDLICSYSLSLGHVLSNVNVKPLVTHWSWLRFEPFI